MSCSAEVSRSCFFTRAASECRCPTTRGATMVTAARPAMMPNLTLVIVINLRVVIPVVTTDQESLCHTHHGSPTSHAMRKSRNPQLSFRRLQQQDCPPGDGQRTKTRG